MDSPPVDFVCFVCFDGKMGYVALFGYFDAAVEYFVVTVGGNSYPDCLTCSSIQTDFALWRHFVSGASAEHFVGTTGYWNEKAAHNLNLLSVKQAWQKEEKKKNLLGNGKDVTIVTVGLVFQVFLSFSTKKCLFSQEIPLLFIVSYHKMISIKNMICPN